MSKDTGGMAFPGFESVSGYGSSKPSYDQQGNVAFENYERGMTLRDWFAGQAICGFCARHELPPNLTDAKVVEYVYHLADAMLNERSKP